METEKRLAEIWSMPYINKLPGIVKERGYWYAENGNKDILITGFNPSFRDGDAMKVSSMPVKDLLYGEKYDNYWGPVRKMLYNGETDLRGITGYLDIFYFREREQKFLKNEILPSEGGMQFVIDQLNLTQHIIEETIRPKLMIVKNKEAQAYFGKLNGMVWMGYEFEKIADTQYGELCRIKGLIDSDERIAPELKSTNIKGSYTLFTTHINQYTSVDKRPTPDFLKQILDGAYEK